MSDGGVPIFTARDLVRRFGRVVALDGLTVDAPGRAIGLLGANGAGKSTLLKILIGMVSPTSGEATILGLDARRRRQQIRSRIGFVPEDDCSFPNMEGVVAVTHAARLSGLGFADALKRAHEMLDFVGLGEERYRDVDTYSTGMKQLLKIAQALVHDPELLVLDEPTNGVDPTHRDSLLALVAELIAGGLRVIISSHLLADVEAICDGVVIIDRGRIVESGMIEELRARGRPRLRCQTTRAVPALEQTLVAEGFEVRPGARAEELILLPPTGAGGDRVAAAAVLHGVGLRLLQEERDSLQDLFLSALDRHSRTLGAGDAASGAAPSDADSQGGGS